MRLSWIRVLGISWVLAVGQVAQGDDEIPNCRAYGHPIPVNNAQVLHFKRTTQNQFRERAHVAGRVVRVYDDRNGHDHFSILIGSREQDTIEVIYNQSFGFAPTPHVGMQVQACGDYITSTAQSGPYPASPDGAIIHWVHKAPDERRHDSGFIVMDGRLYGQDVRNAGSRPRPGKKPRTTYYDEIGAAQYSQ